MFALQFIGLISGAVVVEKVFGVSGIGTAATTAAFQGDRPTILAVVVVMVLIVVLINVVVDIADGLLNPKVRVT